LPSEASPTIRIVLDLIDGEIDAPNA